MPGGAGILRVMEVTVWVIVPAHPVESLGLVWLSKISQASFPPLVNANISIHGYRIWLFPNTVTVNNAALVNTAELIFFFNLGHKK